MRGSKRQVRRYWYSVITVVLGLLVVTGCNKNQNTYISYHKGVDASQHFVFTQQMMSQLMGTYLKSLTDSALLAAGKSNIDGAKVTFVYDTEQRLYFEYPSWGADDGYGHWRTGTYVASTAQDFFEQDALVRFVFNDFSYDKDTLTVDSLVLRNLGKVDGANDQFYIKSNLIRIDYELTDDSSFFSMDEYIKRLKDPSSTYTSPEDQYEIWGELSGITTNNVNYSTGIVEDSAIINALDCNWLKSGPSIVMAENFGYPSFVHFSHPDSCLNNYLIEINGNPFPYPID